MAVAYSDSFLRRLRRTAPPVGTRPPNRYAMGIGQVDGDLVGPSQSDQLIGPPRGGVGAGASSGSSPWSMTIPGYDPDFKALIAGSPEVLESEADLNAYSGQLGDARSRAIRSAIVAAGLVPSIAIPGGIDNQTIEAARQNEFSAAAELGRQRSRGDADVEALLGARGMIHSGGTIGGKQRVQSAYEGATSNLTQDLLSRLFGYEGDYTEKLAAVRAQYNQLKAAAAARVAADPRYQPIGETDAVLDPDSGLYLTPDGRWYQNGPNGPVRVSGPSGGGASGGGGGAAPTTEVAPPSVSPPSSRGYLPATPQANMAAQMALEQAQARGAPPETAALAARSAALNVLYGLGEHAAPAAMTAAAPTPPPPPIYPTYQEAPVGAAVRAGRRGLGF